MSSTTLTKIWWNPYNIDVVVGKLEEEDQFGSYCSYPNPTITIAENLSPTMYFSTLVHELFEFINDVWNLGLKEKDIRILEISVLQLIYNNPLLLDLAKKCLKDDLRRSFCEGSVGTPEV